MTQGIADVSNYNDGMRGGRVRVRAKISQLIKHFGVTQIPFSTNTTTLIDSNEKGKIKIKENRRYAADVEILIHLSRCITR
jgi:topoisomerase-4 subunit A